MVCIFVAETEKSRSYSLRFRVAFCLDTNLQIRKAFLEKINFPKLESATSLDISFNVNLNEIYFKEGVVISELTILDNNKLTQAALTGIQNAVTTEQAKIQKEGG